MQVWAFIPLCTGIQYDTRSKFKMELSSRKKNAGDPIGTYRHRSRIRYKVNNPDFFTKERYKCVGKCVCVSVCDVCSFIASLLQRLGEEGKDSDGFDLIRLITNQVKRLGTPC